MSSGSDAARSERVDAASGADRLSALPEKALWRVLSFLPSREAVRTCVLARQWRDQWKSVPALRITDARDYACAHKLNLFVNSLLLFRNPEPLHVVQINSYRGSDSEEALRYLELWVRHGLRREARVLRLCNNDRSDRWKLPEGLITSIHLKVLELFHVNLKVRVKSKARCLDFSSCPSLEDLFMDTCDIDKARRIISPSVKRLSLKSCHFDWFTRTQISVPNLMFLVLADCEGRTPFLERMPLLVSAFVRLETGIDCCDNKYETGNCNSCMGCRGSSIGSNTSVLFEGLSSATRLELTSHPNEFIFRKDLTHCPVFGKLKTLLLNEWCITTNLGALICFLQHSPILEKLMLQFPENREELVEMDASYDMAKEPFTLKQLTVEVKCHEVDDSISRILNLLHSYGVPYEQIKIHDYDDEDSDDEDDEDYDDEDDEDKYGHGHWPSSRFSFEQDET